MNKTATTPRPTRTVRTLHDPFREVEVLPGQLAFPFVLAGQVEGQLAQERAA